MGHRGAQEFRDQTWLREKYEAFPSETVGDTHRVVQLAAEIYAAGDFVDPALFTRCDVCMSRILQRLTGLFPRSGEQLDGVELKHWLKIGLRADMRRHDQEISPIVDANSLFIFRFYATHAVRYAERHGRNDLRALWQRVAEIARQVKDEHAVPTSSRFGPAGGARLAK